MEEQLIKKIEGGIRSIKFGTKSPQEAGLAGMFERLKKVNEGMHEDLIKKYGAAVAEYNKKNPK